ncbi:DNA mismatch endonuclease Vsr [Paenarthrobacter sp. DKR-5]|uniref:very short patch repair endonuclease n=1 Tax=Paenarthrobacter sp. DKR-5 TaxID=2835535 RepID=UPI001BDD30E7|nr:very short patch repair endonuclease [Paenarthrobacter sp. DKR-5]MBT1004100.1 DNA mismatch endonuclease Vsr [Paenarthrobacter sp. DKR-5]
MADSLTPEARSRNMSRIRGKNTKPELLVRRLIHAAGYRYRLHDKKLPGRPDLVFAGRHKVIFVNGCFWHLHDCKAGQHHPQTNADFWLQKRERTAARDADQRRKLEDGGWSVLTLWECELRNEEALMAEVRTFLGDARAHSAADVVPPAPEQ